MGLRGQLLLVSLTTLLLPWAGFHYVQEMEQALRENQSLSLQQQAELLAQQIEQQRLPTEPTGQVFYTPRRYQPVQVDGYDDDWQSHVSQELAPGVILQKALYEDRLYLFLQVRLPRPVRYFNPSEPFTFSDHVRFTTHNGEAQRQWVLFTSGSGQLQVYQWLRQEDRLDAMADFQAWWQATGKGFNLELSIPTDLLWDNMRLELYQSEGTSKATVTSSTLQPDRNMGERWLKPLDALDPILAGQRTEQRDAVVVTTQGWPLSPQKNWVEQPPDIPPPTNPGNLMNQGINRFYREMIDLLTPSSGQSPWPLAEAQLSAVQNRVPLALLALNHTGSADWFQLPDQQRSALLVSQPLIQDGYLQGYLLLSQTGDALISLTNRALRRVTSLTLIVLLVVIGALLVFASSLSWRIRKLNRAAEQAISDDGKVNRFSASLRQDEIGDLSRSYYQLLQRVRGYTDYLESLNSKLAHELRTPLAVVKSSLELARTQPDNAAYLQRAEEGVERLRRILSAMSEASRVEQSIQQVDLQPFDLVPMVNDMAAAYSDTYAEHRFVAQVSLELARVRGNPELIAQLLDKLVENARAFAPEGSVITLGLARLRDGTKNPPIVLSVQNSGSLLPDGLDSQLFDSLVSRRPAGAQGDDPHLGLGLYIARLIAEAHGGQVAARNLPDGQGVEFSLLLPEI